MYVCHSFIYFFSTMQCKMKRKKLTELQFQLIKDFTLNLYGLCSEEEWGYSDMINEEKRVKINFESI